MRASALERERERRLRKGGGLQGAALSIERAGERERVRSRGQGGRLQGLVLSSYLHMPIVILPPLGLRVRFDPNHHH